MNGGQNRGQRTWKRPDDWKPEWERTTDRPLAERTRTLPPEEREARKQRNAAKKARNNARKIVKGAREKGQYANVVECVQQALADERGGAGKEFFVNLKQGAPEDVRTFAMVAARTIPMEMRGAIGHDLTVKIIKQVIQREALPEPE